MAIESICGRLLNDIDGSCVAPARRYWQQAVLINKSDIETLTINTTDYDAQSPTCAYNVEFTLKCETSGIRVTGIETGDHFKGYYDKTRDANGYPTYKHQVQIFLGGISENVKCALDALDKGSVVVALQLKDGTVEIYGIENGMSTGDYTWDLQAGSGGTAIVLSSLDSSPENFVPLIYKASGSGTESADFDSNFAGAATCA